VGLSMVSVSDHSDPVRQDLGLDFRFQPFERLLLVGNGGYSLYAQRVADFNLSALITATKVLAINLDVRHYAPDLFLARNSILSVFTDTNRTDVGGGLRYQAGKALHFSVDYHALLEPGETKGSSTSGGEAAGRVEWERDGTVAGGEVTYLKTGATGYTGLRGYGRKQFGRAFVAGDVMDAMFKQEVNGQKNSLTGSLSAGYQINPAWSVVVAGRAGVTPYFEQQADAMVKLVYNAVYRVREVK
jgi:autotransporter translocation and assembly factor TamB